MTPANGPLALAALSVASRDEWTFASDLGMRRQFFAPEAFAHPAKLNLRLLQRLIDLYTEPGQTLLDPMAGTGSLMLAATQMRNVIVRDLEPFYVELMQQSASVIRARAGLFAGLIDIGLGDARALECPPFDHIICSPPYACRTHSKGTRSPWARMQLNKTVDLDRRWNYQGVGALAMDCFRYENASGDNAGEKSGDAYWQDMRAIYERCAMFLPARGKLILILKNHYRKHKLIDVVSQTIDLIEGLGLPLVTRHGRFIDKPSLWTRRRREKGLPTVDIEDVLVFEASS